VWPNAPLLRKLIGFGATALTVAAICSGVRIPGEYRQSAPHRRGFQRGWFRPGRVDS
jgi:hypothetical protein